MHIVSISGNTFRVCCCKWRWSCARYMCVYIC